MRREEEIAAAFYDYSDALKLSTFGDFEYIDIQGAFEEGAKWADEHPINVWHDVSEEPQIGSNIVVVDEDGQWWDIQPYDGEYDGYGDLTGWRCCVVHYNIQSWAYISDLLPKGGEK